MQDRWAPFVRPEDLHTSPVPVVRVYDGFEEKDHEDIQGLFTRSGYRIITGGRHNYNNPLEISIELSSSYKVPGSVERARIASDVSGIPLPLSFPLGDSLISDIPIVAKDKNKNRGENKFLLETHEQKVRFAAWMLLAQRFDFRRMPQMSNDEYVEKLKREVSSGHFYLNIGANPTWNDGWIFEEFIESPGDSYSSFRIVPDAYGEVHYGLVTKSSHNKADDVRMTSDPRPTFPNEHAIDPFTNTGLLTQPNSPFYLDSRSVVSNILSGGRGILLGGQTITDPEDRDLLSSLGIDPDSPHIPAELTKAASLIGKALKAGIPFTGIDFMRRKNGEFVLLEVNTGPLLFAQAFGEPAKTPQPKLYHRMYERIIERAKANNPQAFATT